MSDIKFRMRQHSGHYRDIQSTDDWYRPLERLENTFYSVTIRRSFQQHGSHADFGQPLNHRREALRVETFMGAPTSRMQYHHRLLTVASEASKNQPPAFSNHW
jgi:hypothetical protein